MLLTASSILEQHIRVAEAENSGIMAQTPQAFGAIRA